MARALESRMPQTEGLLLSLKCTGRKTLSGLPIRSSPRPPCDMSDSNTTASGIILSTWMDRLNTAIASNVRSFVQPRRACLAVRGPNSAIGPSSFPQINVAQKEGPPRNRPVRWTGRRPGTSQAGRGCSHIASFGRPSQKLTLLCLCFSECLQSERCGRLGIRGRDPTGPGDHPDDDRAASGTSALLP